MTDSLDLERLRGIAQAATPGEWMWFDEGEPYVMNADWIECKYGGNWKGFICATTYDQQSVTERPTSLTDAQFIATFNPSVCLKLLEEIERLREIWKRGGI